ncbi:MAG: hypothetical protein HY851_10385 [candidate division Zixibacteria bacterium]|nr:hypothetical protein [candidate division Zixibacteria bacterium]
MAETKSEQTAPPATPAGSDPTNDYELWLRLRPYIGHCLSLNHDINNPLTTVLGYAELMLESDPPLPENQIEHIKAIAASAERIQALLEKLCREKIELAEQIDLGPVIEAYRKIATPLK